ncbi:alpha/beta-hydrolase [Zopfia rhizophila CBS 207.26]|uniref:Carboxylic ester hydrolase n=1 Tax=Zopfia rhizophila CBS 207.26 TaxID=1314779 RepID=A0A6A6DLA7_9PEZI|nr:alpha/beta-hydrolase [Zopfia rhizophila CBS 207.26]
MKGISVDSDITQYRGIQYAKILARWKDAVLHPFDKSASYTEHGPVASQPSNSINFELGLLQISPSDVPFSPSLPRADEFDCLNLNITAPNNAGSGLPVIVWIHGGAFLLGSGSWPQRDASKLVRLSIDSGKPTIVVSINYRLSVLGMLGNGTCEFEGNYGIRDQRVAFQWVQEYISLFGGDPARVTIMGESAGSASVHFHIVHTELPLFSRAVMMGGSLSMIGERSVSDQALAYEAVVSAVGGKENLYKLPADELMAKLPPTIPWGPAAPTGTPLTTFSTAGAAPSWMEAVVVGYCGYDGSIMQGAFGGRPDPARQFVDIVENLLPRSSAAFILDRYGLSCTTPKAEAIVAISQFCSDTGFGLGGKTIARGFAEKGYFYTFSQGNPFQGPLQGRASHVLDEMFFWGTMEPILSESDVAFGKKWATSLLDFVGGGKPWSGVAQGKMMCFGPGGKVEETDFPQHMRDLEEIGFDRLWNVWQVFIGQQ